MSRVYVFSVTRLGDLVESTLVLDFLRARHPEGVVLVTSPVGRPFVEADPRLAEVRAVPSSHPLVWRAQVARVLAQARSEGAAVVNLEMYVPRWRFLRRVAPWLARDARHLDLLALRGEFPLATERGDASCITHRSRFYARAVGMDDAPPPALHVSDAAREQAVTRLREAGLEPARTVVLHAGCSPGWKVKRGDPAWFGRAARGLLERHGMRSVMIGTGDDADAADAVARTGAPVHDWTGRLAPAELIGLLASASLFVGNDSGPLKVAEAVGTATISLWSDTWPEQAAPRGPRHRAIRFAPAPHRCSGEGCAVPAHVTDRVAPEEVADALLAGAP